MKSKKSDVNWVLIGLVLALVVLLVLAFELYKEAGSFDKNAHDCSASQGKCVPKGTCSGTTVPIVNKGCPESQECCIQ
jgi:hypothetical protein